ncbi:glycosyltransferase [Sphingomonas sp. R86520]|uniref:glycosyltransferase n=1 Tax=Sphingomonas sp. R86520 TaxID=3093859 RepID=UPI0036D2A34B
MIVLGGSPHHPGGLEGFCERATTAINRHTTGWTAEWRPSDTASAGIRRLPAIYRAWRRLDRLEGVALVWLQWSTLLDLMLLPRLRALGVRVMVTPHLGANSRLQRVPVLRALCLRLLRHADRLALLFPEQDAEITLPAAVPRTPVRTFLPEIALASPDRPNPNPGTALHLIHAGRLSHGKGTFRMVALCAALRARGLTVEGRIVGRADPATMAALVRAIDEAGLGETLTLVDWLDEAALIAALADADILVHLSELDSYPLIVLEALAAGTVPVVADMIGAGAMVARYGGFVSDGSSVAAAADWLAAQDRVRLRHDAAVAAMRVRQDHRWPACVDRLVEAANLTMSARR